MQALRNSIALARLVMAWFALTLGMAIASSPFPEAARTPAARAWPAGWARWPAASRHPCPSRAST
ncbi:hypothetical protein [Delftia tsuruhatensis]|uniref:hypothetical protein n=1 Tax=Delftia tsuruhatensis TaxID=180282 RepID=UPI001F30E91B|nr:hypothetical protein [Delftia tsuruhatensis]